MFPVVKEPVLKCFTCCEYFENNKCLRDHQLLNHGQVDNPAVWPEHTHVLPHNNVPPEIQDWRPRFNFSVSLAEILYSWGFLRRKTSQPDRERLVIAEAATVKENGHSSENIELSTFDKFGGGVLQTSPEQSATCNLLSSSPAIHLSSCSLFCDSEPLRAIASASTGLDSASLKSFVWPEVHDTESGMGHEFFASDVCYPTWCDRCGDLLWGLQGEYLRCQNCHYTCHPQCRDLVTLDCSPAEERTVATSSPPLRLPDDALQHTCTEPENEASSLRDTVAGSGTSGSEDQGLVGFLSDEQRAASAHPVFDITMLLSAALRERGLSVNDLSSNLFLGDWEEDGASFRGFIRVHMNLCRPISVVAGTRPPSIYDILKEDSSLERTLTSFYLPPLLKKFKVVDNPRKFVLYERHYEDGETSKVKMRRIADNETPLNLALRWSKDLNCNKMFWEAFSLPELSNFLRILDREEEEYKRQVRVKYQQIALKIREAMERLVPSAAQSADACSEVEGCAAASAAAHAG
ncbi:hypothetical protein B566_EDAN015046 [Ephemera danica]|nr:hypothetical protein B566_EDAN015046 [Ephemera danica]